MKFRDRVKKIFTDFFWTLQPPVSLLLKGEADEMVGLLMDAAKPKQNQLHLRDLYISGRRYQIRPFAGGFDILTNSKEYWRYFEGVTHIRNRTRTAAIVVGKTSPVGDQYTRIELNTHIRLGYLLDTLLIPVFFSSIVVFMPWPWWIITIIVLMLFGLSFSYHHFQAMHQANEIIFFVHKVLHDRTVTNLPALESTTPDLVNPNVAFEAEWERFYNTYRREEED